MNVFQKAEVISVIALYLKTLENQCYRAALALHILSKFSMLHSNTKHIIKAQTGLRRFQPTQIHLSRDHVSENLQSPDIVLSLLYFVRKFLFDRHAGINLIKPCNKIGGGRSLSQGCFSS